MDTKKIHYIKLDNMWFSLNDLYNSIQNGFLINPINKKKLSKEQIEYIKKSYKNIHYVDTELNLSKNDLKEVNDKLDDHIELFESQITELFSKQEELYQLIHNQQHMIDTFKK